MVICGALLKCEGHIRKIVFSKMLPILSKSNFRIT
uniref:Uncharacterized protein n=1 Tax=Utricularia reniformis TaxID=192314 RepID=A0A1Y0B095_9LAMI|nr:hypothetical protein AEK19_MT0564 [Utricularia reniformis]ART30820.1 hypothetical protein AEK19_MT0564 [Utricularia reniformis]